MIKNSHIIQQQVFDISFDREDKAAELQGRVSRLYHERLTAVITAVMDEYCPGHVYLQLDSLELDIGTLPYINWEDELVVRVKNQLSEQLSKLRASGNPGQAGRLAAAPGYSLQILMYFLRNGVLPWQAVTGREYIATLFSDLMRWDARQLIAALKQISYHQDVCRRLVFQLSDPAIISLVRALAPAYADQIINYAIQLRKKQEKERILQTQTRDFHVAQWEFILSYLLNTRSSYFDSRSFLKFLIERMARHFNLSYFVLLQKLAGIIPHADFTEGKKEDLTAMISNLYQEELQATIKNEQDSQSIISRAKLVPAAEQEELYTHTAFMRYLLSKGKVPAMYSAVFQENEAYWLRQIDRGATAELKKIIEGAPQQNLPVILLSFYSAKFIDKLIRAVFPVNAALMMSWADKLYQVLTSGSRSVNVSAAAFSEIKHEVILTGLLQGRYEQLKTADFLGELIIRLGSRQGGNVRSLVEFAAHYQEQQYPANPFHSALLQAIRNFALPGNASGSPGIAAGGLGMAAQEELELAVSEQLLYRYLETGQLPPQGGRSWLASRYAVLWKGRKAGILAYLQAGAGYNTNMLYRLAALMGRQEYQLLIEQLKPATGQSAGRADLLVTELKSIYPEFAKHETSLRVLQLALMLYTSIVHTQPGPVISNKLVQQLEPAFRTLYQKFIDGLRTGKIPYPVHSPAIAYLLPKQAVPVLPAAAPKAAAQLPAAITGGQWQLVEFFLRTGKLPWWMAVSQRDIKAAFTMLLKKDAALLYRKLSGLAVQPGADERIRHLAGTAQLFRLIASQHPESRKLVSWALTLKKQIGNAALLQAAEAVSLSLLFHYRTAPSALSDSLTTVLKRISSRYGIAAARLLAALQQTFPKSAAGRHVFFDTMRVATQNLQPVKAVKKDKGSFNLDELVNFLMYGSIPGDFYAAGDRNLLFFKYLQEKYPATIRQHLLTLLKTENLRASLVARGQEALLSHILACIAGNSQGSLLAVIRQMKEVSEKIKVPGRRLSEPSWFWLYTFAYLSKAAAPHTAYYAVFMIKAWADATAIPEDQLYTIMIKAARSSSSFAELAAALNVAAGSLEQPAELTDTAPQETDKPKDTEEAEVQDPVYIKNAGMVLLWPFLGAFFKRLELADDNGFRGLKESYRGVHLLQYLVSGLENTAEYELVLNKLICGVETAKPVIKNLKLSRKEKEVSESLLQHVIAQWSVIGNTSIAGLREAFLMRDGRLLNKAGAWELHVEQKAYDMLLDRLPWSISIIKLSWMKQALFVTWK